MELDNGVSLDFANADGPIRPQHYAFLISEADFDAVLGRIRKQGLDHWADPTRRRAGEINHNDGGRGVYFCDPRPPWQRGSNENTNRLLRQYLPHGTDLALHSQAKLSAIARQLNERPRKTLLYKTPAETFAECVAAIS